MLCICFVNGKKKSHACKFQECTQLTADNKVTVLNFKINFDTTQYYETGQKCSNPQPCKEFPPNFTEYFFITISRNIKLDDGPYSSIKHRPNVKGN